MGNGIVEGSMKLVPGNIENAKEVDTKQIKEDVMSAELEKMLENGTRGFIVPNSSDTYALLEKLAEIGKVEVHKNQVGLTVEDGGVSLKFVAGKETLAESLEEIKESFGKAAILTTKVLGAFGVMLAGSNWSEKLVNEEKGNF